MPEQVRHDEEFCRGLAKAAERMVLILALTTLGPAGGAALRGAGDPVGLPGLAVLAVGFVVFLLSLAIARSRREPGEAGSRKSRRSILGIVVQGVGIGIGGFGPPWIALDPLSATALIEAAIVATLMATTIGLFFWASRTMGRNWSLVARTRDDHELVTTGPFALIRHPIYTALFLFMLAIAIASGHTGHLIVAIPLYAIGTWLRISEEERLLRTMFGPAYEAYATRVKRFVPGVF